MPCAVALKHRRWLRDCHVRKRRACRAAFYYDTAMLDADACYRALKTHDRRFDGKFFVGVKSTRIYCRPICPARTPRRDRCSFFVTAVQAERAGFMPCLRCRPDLAPGNAVIDAKARLARRAVQLIRTNWSIRVEELAARLSVTARHLRRAMHDELAVTPLQVKQSRRMAVAKHLLRKSNLPLIRVAFASGFASLRRFNAALKEALGQSPSEFRAQSQRPRPRAAASGQHSRGKP